MNYKKLALTVAAGAMATTMMAQSAPQLNANNIDEVIKAMTLEEKAQLLVGGGNDGFVGSGAMLGHQKKFVPGAAGITVAIPRLGIPATVQCDGPAGVHIDAHREGDSRSYFATGFPIGTCLASTWNTDLVRKVGEAIGNETLEYGCDVVLGPGMNLHRNPLCGRNFEYYSEDPFLSGTLAASVTKGVQSHKGCGVTIKHFACNNQEDNRMGVDVKISERTLREIYLRGFEIAVKEGQPTAIMSSYNLVNGVHAANSKDLCTRIARTEWGFDGVIMSDWNTTVPEDGSVAWKCAAAGNDIIMPGNAEDAESIREAYRNGDLTEEEIRSCAGRILELISQLA